MKFKALADYYALLKSLGITGIYKVSIFLKQYYFQRAI